MSLQNVEPKAEAIKEDRNSVKKLRSFITYHQQHSSPDSEHFQQVTHLAQHFASLDVKGRKELAKSWSAQCGSKGNLKVYLSQTIWQESASSGGDLQGFMTPGQIAKLLNLELAGLPSDTLQQTILKEIEHNQQLHGVDPVKGKQAGSSFWLDRYMYKHVKATDNTHQTKSNEELVRTGDLRPGESNTLHLLDAPTGAAIADDEKQSTKLSAMEAKRVRKANTLIEGMMKLIQQCRTSALLAKSKKENGLKERIKHLECVELWAVEGLQSLESQTCSVDLLDSIQDASVTYRAELQEHWGLRTSQKRPLPDAAAEPASSDPAKVARQNADEQARPGQAGHGTGSPAAVEQAGAEGVE